MATLKANGTVVVFTARVKPTVLYRPTVVHKVMINGAALRPRGYKGGGFKKVRTVAQSRGLTFGEIAAEYEANGYTIEWHDSAQRTGYWRAKTPVKVKRPRGFGSSRFYAGVGQGPLG